jgi:hypothetical protein
MKVVDRDKYPICKFQICKTLKAGHGSEALEVFDGRFERLANLSHEGILAAFFQTQTIAFGEVFYFDYCGHEQWVDVGFMTYDL